MKPTKFLPLLALLILSTVELLAQSSLVRGPYLNTGTSSSMIVRWRTSANEGGIVEYGTDMNNLDQTATHNGSTVEHIVSVSGLSPNTKYYYRIGDGNGNYYSNNDGSYYFVTSPTIGTKQAMRFWAIGDFGNGSQAQIDVKNGFLQNYTDVHTDVWFWLGDNAYGDGTDQQYQDKVFAVYPDVFKNTVVWPSPGNHDYGSVDLGNNGPYYDIFSLPTNGEAGGEPSGEEGHYSFDYGNVHFLSLNTEYLLWIISNNTSFTQWLEQDLQNTDADFIIAYWHQPAYTKGSHDSDDDFSRPQMMRQNVLPILEQYGVDLVLAGHSHGYERSYLIKDHFGKSDTWDPNTMLVDGTNGNANDGNAYMKYTMGNAPNEGTVYAVVGCSGQKSSGHPLDHPVMYMSTEDYYGSMVIDVNGLELRARFIDTTGAVLDDFTILKEESTGIEQADFKHNVALKAYPNPFKDDFTIEFALEKREKVLIEIYDIMGNLIERFDQKEYEAGEHKFNYRPTQTVAEGVYMVELKTESRQGAKRLVRME